jgi:hypothetical protein
MSSADRAFERAAAKLDELADEAAAKGGLAEKAAPALADDADFLRTIEPTLVAARIRGERQPRAPRRRPPGRAGGSPARALAPVGAAFALGVVVAKLVDWRSYAEPRV